MLIAFPYNSSSAFFAPGVLMADARAGRVTHCASAKIQGVFMTKQQKSRLIALKRIQVFLDENHVAAGTVNNSRSRAALDALIPVLGGHAADQHSATVAAKSKTEIKAGLRRDLRVHHMQPVASIAKAKLAGVTDTALMAKLAYPDGDFDDEALVAAGHSMAEAASNYRQVFVDEQLPGDFVEQLQAAAEALGKATADRDSSLLKLRAATGELGAQFSRASDVVRVLNSLVVKQLAGQEGKDGLLLAWKSAKRVHRGNAPVQVTDAPVAPIAPVPPAPQTVTAPEVPVAKAA
jgi:hypothetical protein